MSCKTQKQMSYYLSNKEKVLQYKKDYYRKKREKYMALKPILIKGFSKKQSNELIKNAIDKNCLVIRLNDKKDLSINDFVKQYKLIDYRVIETTAFVSSDSGAFLCDENPFEDSMECVTENNYSLTISLYENPFLQKKEY